VKNRKTQKTTLKAKKDKGDINFGKKEGKIKEEGK
jgi:hypothetical protein